MKLGNYNFTGELRLPGSAWPVLFVEQPVVVERDGYGIGKTVRSIGPEAHKAQLAHWFGTFTERRMCCR